MLKAWLPRPPRFFVVDFKPSWESAARKVFPTTLIIICIFHSEQLLTRALIKEFARLRRIIDSGFIKGCRKLRDITKMLEKEGILANTSWIEHDIHRKWFEIYQQIYALDRVNDVLTFTAGYEGLIESITLWDEEIVHDYVALLSNYLPKHGFTEKGLKYAKPKLRKTWRTILHGIRVSAEENSASFWNGCHLVLKKPCNMSPAEKISLREYLTKFPFMRGYRETLRRFYRLFDRQGKSTPSLEFLNDIIQEDSHESLKAAVKTLQSKAEQVFNFRKLSEIGIDWKTHKSARVNAEHVNTRINKLARNGYGFRLWKSARFRLEAFLKCPVFISQALISKET